MTCNLQLLFLALRENLYLHFNSSHCQRGKSNNVGKGKLILNLHKNLLIFKLFEGCSFLGFFSNTALMLGKK